MTIAENVHYFREELKDGDCSLVAISKTKSVSEIAEAYHAGLRDFGENKVQELTVKHESLPEDIRWHMVGHLQRNKVKYLAPFIYLIHSVDSLKLLNEIHKQGEKAGRIIACLLQVHIAEEETKFGFDEKDIRQLIHDGETEHLNFAEIKGLMGMATYTEDEEKVRREFRKLASLFRELKSGPLPANMHMEHLSMGMSGDYKIAMEEGSTLIRIGTAIFGERNYHE